MISQHFDKFDKNQNELLKKQKAHPLKYCWFHLNSHSLIINKIKKIPLYM